MLAERLYVRGGLSFWITVWESTRVIIICRPSTLRQVRPVQPGTILGEVGTTGLSTGNHLHWDVLVNGIWVDPAAWQEQGSTAGCWRDWDHLARPQPHGIKLATIRRVASDRQNQKFANRAVIVILPDRPRENGAGGRTTSLDLD